MAYVAVSESPIYVHAGNRPDQGLPGGPPDYPSQGLPGGGSVDNTLPVPPPMTWPPPNFTRPIVPIYPPESVPPGTIWPPAFGGHPGHPLPPEHGHPGQPLPPDPGRPDHGLPGGGNVDNTLPRPPGRPDNSLPSPTFWVVCGIPGVGWRYVCVDPSLTVGYPMPPGAEPKG